MEGYKKALLLPAGLFVYCFISSAFFYYKLNY
jgi:hypothetical protein